MKALYYKKLESKEHLEVGKEYEYEYMFLDPKYNTFVPLTPANGKIDEFIIIVESSISYYGFTKEEFDNHFITVKELRKFKLEKINESR